MSYMRSFLLLLGALSLGTARVVPRYSWQVSASEVARTKYDFVIAGGGVAGLTIADRLTENPSGRQNRPRQNQKVELLTSVQ